MTTVKQFPVLTCPSVVRDTADDFSDLFPKHYRSFVSILCGAFFGISCLSNILRYFGFSDSVSSMSRFLNDEGSLWEKLNRRHRRRLLRLLPKIQIDPDRYMWAIDDTLIKRSGRSIWACDWWHDHTTNSTVWGQKLLVLGIVDRKRKILIPVYWEMLHREDKKDKSKSHEKGWEVALKLLNLSTEAGFPKLLVVTDSWFAGEDFFCKLKKSGFKFVIEIKSNRIVVQNERQSLHESIAEFFKCKKRHKIIYHGIPKWATAAVVRFNEGKEKMRVAAVANRKGQSEEAFAFYVTYELAWDAAKLWAASRDRWAVEVQFRELKQLFTLGEVAVQSKQAVETSISVAVIALTTIRLEQLSQADVKSENQYVRPIPAGAIVRDIQLRSLASSIAKLTENKNGELEKIRERINIENFGQKPTLSRKNHKRSSEKHIQKKCA